MADWLSREQRSHNMASIRSFGNGSTEQRMQGLLRFAHLTGWRRHLPLPGKPDFVFRRERVAVFVDGCFWHGCPRCYRLPQDNRAYWKAKVEGNRGRDLRATRSLRSQGWTVLRVWEHMLKTESGRSHTVARIANALNRQSFLSDA
jgi:DNA mismatch endonuclease (patch repair protein)